MATLAMLSAAGLWPAVPIAGWAALRSTVPALRQHFEPVTLFSLSAVAGIAIWSPVLLGAAMLGAFSGAWIGLVGWIVTGLSAASLIARRFRPGSAGEPATARPARSEQDAAAGPQSEGHGKSAKKARRSRTGAEAHAPRRSAKRAGADWVRAGLVLGITLAGLLYLGFPAESIYGGRDEGVYAMHGTWIARHGRLDVPYPWPDDAHDVFKDIWVGFPGFYKTEPTMTVQFGHLFSVWLAQAHATLGEHGLFRLNAVFAVLFIGAFYGLSRTALPAPYAAAATLFLAFNPSQLWMARITLSEILTQLLVWSGLLLLTEGLRIYDRRLARWAGILLGLSAFVRFDSLLLVPMLLLAHLAARIVEEPTGKSSPAWTALYQTALPAFALAFAYFWVFSRPYVIERPYLDKLAVACVVAPAALLLAHRTVLRHVRPWLTHDATLAALSLFLLAVAAYAYWWRPIPEDPSKLVRRWPGYLAQLGLGSYRRDALVNLGSYVSAPVVWAAIAGWLAGLWSLVRTGRDRHVLAVLVVVLGFSVVYLYDHGNTPDHFWTIRRFVPVIIPGFVLSAALGARLALERLPSPARPLVAGGIVFLLAVFIARADRLIAAFAEDPGYYGQMRRLAQELPPDQTILARGFTTWVTPLYVAFDRKVVPLNLDKPEVRAAAQGWIERRAREGEPAYFVDEVRSIDIPRGGDLLGFPGVAYASLGRFEIVRTFTESTVHPLPGKVVSDHRRIDIKRLELRGTDTEQSR